jgi:hypothetical protein
VRRPIALVAVATAGLLLAAGATTAGGTIAGNTTSGAVLAGTTPIGAVAAGTTTSGTVTAGTTTSDTAAAGAAPASPALPTITLTMNGSTIVVGGTPQSGGVDIVSTVSTEKEGDPILFLLKPAVSVEEAYAALSSTKDPNTLGRYGSIVFDSEAPAGTSEAQTTLAPGQYIAVDSGQEGPAKRPNTSFIVPAAASPATLPAPAATIRSIDFGFRGPSTLYDGELVRFENEGFLVHMDVALLVKSERTAKRVVKLLQAGKEKAAAKLAVGGVGFAGPLSTGAYQQETITAKPGVYVEACFMDTQDGRSHTQLGMERIIHILK